MTRQTLAFAIGSLLFTGSMTMAQSPACYQTSAYNTSAYNAYNGGYGAYGVTPVSYARPWPVHTPGYRTAYAGANWRPSLSYPTGAVSSCQATPYTPYQASAYNVGYGNVGYGNVGSNYYVGRNLIGEPKLFGRNEPIRNAFRFIFP